MREFIARAFNLVTKEAYMLLTEENRSLREQLAVMRVQLIDKDRSLGEEVTERKKLQEIIFKSHGITRDPEPVPSESPSPIKVSRERWSSLKGRMEADDRIRAEREHDAQRPV